MSEISNQDISTLVSQELSQTPYECSSLTRLSGGTANFVYRGILARPLQDGTKTIIIKHGEEFVASKRDFKLTTDRCLFEETIVKALNDFPATTETDTANNTSCTVKTPRLFQFSHETNTQILEDLPGALDLKTFMLLPTNSQNVSRELAASIGRALGKWLLAFHTWVSEESQKDLVKAMEKNEVMRDIKFMINYDNLAKMVDQFPALLKESQHIFREVRDMAAAELGRKDGKGFGVIHGDFWSGNVLIPSTALDQQNDIPLFVTDWELCHWGSRALDLGQMVAELYQLKHFKNVDAGVWLIEGLLDGYGPIDDDMAFRIAIHVGVHFLCLGSTVPGWGTNDQVEGVVKIGRDLVVNGWQKDLNWFGGGWLKCLFPVA
ncbi:hypothetical protein CNMCM6936_007695 [Aspergillus lentulus]|uniref:Aminoglycoside phosphotransferase domain-containing protein n=1 Tax=Aspergillus lentulus TaxID=293939 RepID=A0AAN6BND8_ASPLE|nr:hypothetical protein CNMCM6936_007695 [Aspergillus lentulus]KAF4203897.1 hypothetical protein CNMCM8927_008280 [Aspergillus lentulus]